MGIALRQEGYFSKRFLKSVSISLLAIKLLRMFNSTLYPKSLVKVEPYGYCVNEIIIFSSNYFTPIAVNAIENMVLLRTILLWGDYGFHQGAKTGQK